MGADVTHADRGHRLEGLRLRTAPLAAVAEAGQHLGVDADTDRRRGTRLLTRVRAVYDWSKPHMALLGVVLMEFGDFAMMRRMLLGIRHRAEALARQAPVAA